MGEENKLTVALQALAAWETPIGTRPFAGANSVHPEDRSREVLHDASCIVKMLAAACFDARTLADQNRTSEFTAMDPRVLATALNGVGKLVDFGTMLLEG